MTFIRDRLTFVQFVSHVIVLEHSKMRIAWEFLATDSHYCSFRCLHPQTAMILRSVSWSRIEKAPHHSVICALFQMNFKISYVAQKVS